MPDINWITMILGLSVLPVIGALMSIPLYFVLHKMGALDDLED